MAQDYIITYTGVKFTPLQPKEEQIRIEDIAHALSMLCRANGHYREFYSVASHCVTCYQEAKARGYSKKVQLGCLLHDAAEAYLADVTRPVKKHMPVFSEVEDRLLTIIFQRFINEPITKEEYKQIFDIDDAMLYHEFLYFTGVALGEETTKVGDQQFISTLPRAGEAQYLEVFKSLI